MSTHADERADREAIVDCLHRLSRGQDRLDDELILSAYHPDAMDYHGKFQGSPQEFVEWLRESHATRTTNQLFLSNFTIDLDGDTAHVETYFMVPIRRDGSPNVNYTCGRYIDRFDRRGGEWRIAVRVVVTESVGQATAVPIDPGSDTGRRDRSDISYVRPLEGPPPPQQR